MAELKILKGYSDDRGNRIICPREIPCRSLKFIGKNNLLQIHPEAVLPDCDILFAMNGASCFIGKTTKVIGRFDLGEGTEITIGDGCYTTGRIDIAVSMGAKIIIGKDCLFAMSVIIRGTSGHPIFSTVTGELIGISKGVHIGDHAWVSRDVTILDGTTIGDGPSSCGCWMWRRKARNNPASSHNIRSGTCIKTESCYTNKLRRCAIQKSSPM